LENMDIASPDGLAFLARHFSGSIVRRVPRTAAMPENLCYQNVRQLLATRGGAAVLGWSLRQQPAHWLEATHHAVWRDNNGVLQDVTALPISCTEDHTLFIEDGSDLPHIFDPATPSIFYQIDDCQSTKAWIIGNKRRMRLIADLYAQYARQKIVMTPAGLQRQGGNLAKITDLEVSIARISERLSIYAARLEKGFYDWDPRADR